MANYNNGRELVMATAQTLASLTDVAARAALDVIPSDPVMYEVPAVSEENFAPVPQSAEVAAYTAAQHAEQGPLENIATADFESTSSAALHADLLASAQSDVQQALQGVDDVQIP